MKLKKWLWLFFLVAIPLHTIAQGDTTSTKINDIFLNKAFIDYGAEYYKISDKNSILEHHILFQPFVNDVNILNIEFGLTHSFLDSVKAFSPADLSISYQRNFLHSNYGELGYQGHAAKLKLIIPTGRGEYLSGSNSWAVEPLLGFQWHVFTNDFITAWQIRYNYNFGALPDKAIRPDFVRVEYSIGFDNTKQLVFIDLDYRRVTQNNSHSLFINFEIGTKVSERTGIRFSAKPRIIGDDFNELSTILGLYHFF